MGHSYLYFSQGSKAKEKSYPNGGTQKVRVQASMGKNGEELTILKMLTSHFPHCF